MSEGINIGEFNLSERDRAMQQSFEGKQKKFEHPKDAFAASIDFLNKKGANDIGKIVDQLPIEKLQVLDSKLNAQGESVGTLGVLGSYPSEKQKILALFSELEKTSQSAEIEKICDRIAGVIKEL